MTANPSFDRRLGWMALSLWLAACSSTPPREPADATAVPAESRVDSPMVAFERAQLERALQLVQQGRHAEAANAWEVLTLLRPEVMAYQDRLEQARARADADAGEHLRRAELARRRGDLDGAQTQYLLALQLQPEQAQAADGLRAIERERNKRYYLGRLSRVTLGKRGGVGTEMVPAPKPAASAPQGSADAGKGSASGAGSGTGSGRAAEVLKPLKRATPP